jgi:hypothetical protein
VKHCLRERSFDTIDGSPSSSEVVSDDVQKIILNAAFFKWIERLEHCNIVNSDRFGHTEEMVINGIISD